jgi:hypothetical protein
MVAGGRSKKGASWSVFLIAEMVFWRQDKALIIRRIAMGEMDWESRIC